MHFRVRAQIAEALCDLNRYYCSLAHCRPVSDAETLFRYFVQSGGAADFARRFTEAMGDLNRWFASEYHHRHVHDPETLWSYYNEHRNDRRMTG